MSLLEIYKSKNSNKTWFDDHSKLSKKSHGRMFEYTNTNFRSQDSFLKDFVKFLEVENVPREDWPKIEKTGQEVHKHMVVNMIQSKLFKRDVEGIFSKTAKGILYNDFVASNHGEDEKWFLNYLFLLNGYYFDKKNYIIDRVREDLLGFLLIIDGLGENKIKEYAKNILQLSSTVDILRSEFFYIHSFYNDSDFLISYFRSSEQEKNELADYIQENLDNKEFNCCISLKYKPSGNFTINTLFDETKVFLLTLLFIKSENVNLNNILDVFIKNYLQFIPEINVRAIIDYIDDNKQVFDPIFSDVLELDDLDLILSDDISEIEEETSIITDTPEEFIDETSEVGKQRIKAVFALRKKQARLQSGYACGLEVVNNCRPIYFTAKANKKNYLELHHFIPREFRNDFSNSIEVLANYVTLCPRCHRQIHLAIDRERKHLINSIYNERKDRLETVGLSLQLKDIYKYYRITD